MTIHVEIVSQDRVVYQGEADVVILPGVQGDLGILPNHSPLLTVLQYGIIKIRREAEEEIFTVFGGVAEVQPDQVTVLADSAENVEEIDAKRADAARKCAEKSLKEATKEDRDERLEIWSALRRSQVRLNAIQRYRQRLQGSSPDDKDFFGRE